MQQSSKPDLIQWNVLSCGLLLDQTTSLTVCSLYPDTPPIIVLWWVDGHMPLIVEIFLCVYAALGFLHIMLWLYALHF